ncbi:MAG: DinB family protein [Pseudomonadota bacterium]
MITPEYLQHMARYNRWQNIHLFAAADTLDDAARRADRGAFFGSVHGTLAHLMWGDLRWIARYDGEASTEVPVAESGRWITQWEDLKSQRWAMDARIIAWAETAGPGDVDGMLNLRPSGATKSFPLRKAVGLMQLFNHQTHHRGQVHAMLTAAGADSYVTDIPFMPAEV